MRQIIFASMVAIAGCGSGSGGGGNGSGSGGGKSDVDRVLDELGEIKDKMCACKDAACAKSVAGGRDPMNKLKDLPDSAFKGETGKRADEIQKAYRACRTAAREK